MKRRIFFMGLTAIGLGGCLRFQENGLNNSPTSQTTSTEGTPEIEVLSLKRKVSSVNSWEYFDFDIVIANRGLAPGQFDGMIQVNTQDGWKAFAPVTSEIPADEVRTVTTQAIAGVPGEKQFRIKGHDVQSSIKIVEPEFGLGDEFRHADDQYTISVNRFELEDTVRYKTDNNTTRTLTFPSGENQFGFVWVTYSSSEPGLGPPLDITVIDTSGNEYTVDEYPRYVNAGKFTGRFDGTYILENGGPEPGKSVSAWVPVVVPKPFPLDKIRVAIGFTDPPGAAHWVR